MTLNGAITLPLRYFTEFSSFLGALRKKWLKMHQTFRGSNAPKESSFSDVSFMALFAEITERTSAC